MKRNYTRIVAIALTAIFATACSSDLRDENILTEHKNNRNGVEYKSSVTASGTVYYLNEDFKTMCLVQDETTLSSLESYIASSNNYPTISSPKWYGYNYNGVNGAKNYGYFYAIDTAIKSYYNLSNDKIKFRPKVSDLQFPEFGGDSSISKAYLYLNGYYGVFYPDNEISAETATTVMHALFNEIDNYSLMYNKNLYAISYHIEKTICGVYMGLVAEVYYK